LLIMIQCFFAPSLPRRVRQIPSDPYKYGGQAGSGRRRAVPMPYNALPIPAGSETSTTWLHALVSGKRHLSFAGAGITNGAARPETALSTR